MSPSGSTARPADPPLPPGLTEGLNAPQAAAVAALLGPLLVVAGPGSGKTRVLTHRIAAIVATGLASPEQVLAVTFTNKAAGEMRERLDALVGEQATQRMWVSTFHSLCARLLRVHHDAAGLPRAFTIVDASDARSVLRQVCLELGVPAEAGDVRGYASAISRAKNGAPTRPDRVVSLVAEGYREALTRMAAVDFDDLLLRALELLESSPEVLARYQERFRFVLVDEYQDTNPVQYRLVELLTARHRNLCVVGDADQAIYGFRAATPAALHGFTQAFPDARVVVLEENYRSTSAILEVCQAVIDPAPSAFRPRLFTSNGAGDAVRLVIADDDRDEAALVAGELAARPPSLSAAVLVRVNAQTRAFEEALLAARVPYQVVGALRFYDRAEVKDALAWLRLVVNPQDVLALSRVVSAPRRGLGEKAVQALVAASASAQEDLLSVMADPERFGLGGAARSRWAVLAEVLTDVAAAARRGGPGAALRAVLSAGLRAHVAAGPSEQARDRVANLDELVSAADAFVTRPDATDPEGRSAADLGGWEQTVAFLANVALVSAADASEDGEAPVAVLTAHSSKGKEFDWVYVVGLEEGLFPHGRAGESAPDEEERRLLFVACSRARQRLVLTRAERRMLFGKVVECEPSRFLADLPDSVQVHISARPRFDSPWSARPSPSSPSPRSRRPRPPAGPRLAAADAQPGRAVHHGAFGDGVIVGVDGAGDAAEVTVRFGDGLRVLRLSLAPLRLLPPE